jgi:asparagine synthase (glutamine-hydrolysing)
MPFGLTDHRRSEDSYAKELEEILKRSVARALVSDVPVGTFISGGVDSTLASALAARLRPGIKSFTLSHPDAGEVDEVANARATAAMHNITLVEVPSTDGFKMAWDAELVRALEEPWLSLDAGFLLTPVAAQHGMKVMVGASGVDQCFMGFRYEQRIQYWDWCRRFAPVLGALPPWGGRLNSLRRWASLPTLAHVYAYRFSCLSGALLPEECEQMFDPSFLSRVEQRDTAQVLMDIYSFDENRYEDRIQGMTALDISTFLCNRLLRDVDQEAGYSGVEARSIALDQEFLEFTARLPVELKIRDGSRKYLMRRIAKPYIHPNCLIQGKHRHNTPMERWLAGPLKEFALEKLAALEKISIFHPQALGTARFQISNSDVAWPRCNRIWQMVSTQCWLEGSFAGGSGSE